MARPRGSSSTLERLAAAYPSAPFRLRDVVAAGLATRGGVRSCLGAGQLVRLRPGVAVARSALEQAGDDPREYHLLQVRAVVLTLPRPGWASLESAAMAYDLPRRLAAAEPRALRVDVPGLPDAELDALAVPPGLPALLPIHLHGTRLPQEQRTVIDDVPVTSLERTAVELCRGRPLHISLVPVDEALRRLALADAPAGCDVREYLARHEEAILAGRARLLAVTDLMRGWPGVVAAREAVARADPRAESPLESCSRGFVLERNLPRPEVGVPVVADGRTYYGDLVWRTLRVIGEADGWCKYAADPMGRLRAEKHREDALRRAGWIVVRWTSDELLRTPGVVIARIEAALVDARRRLTA